MLSQDDSGISHEDLRRTRLQTDEADAVSIMDIVETSWVNPDSTEKLNIMKIQGRRTRSQP